MLAILAMVAVTAVALPLCHAYRAETVAAQNPANCSRHGLPAADPRGNPLPPAGEGVSLHAAFTSSDIQGQYHLFTRDIDFSEPVGVVVRLHGDGGWEFDHPEGLVTCLAAVAASHNMILLAPATPDTAPARTWWQDMGHNRAWVTDLVDETVDTYSVDPNKVWWAGYSGGAEFLSYSLAFNEIDAITGGAVMIGGGGAPRQGEVIGVRERPELAGTPLTWAVGIEDDGSDPAAPFDALGAARRGSAFYTAQGFTDTTLIELEEHGHFDMPQAQILDRTLSEYSPARWLRTFLAG